MAVLSVELIRILDASESRAGSAVWLNYLAYGLAVPAIAGLLVLARERRFALPLATALLTALIVPLVFWSGRVVGLPGKAVVAGLILVAAIGFVVAGVSGGVRRIMLAGSALFGLAILILLGQTIGTLLDQSVFFLVAGGLLLALAGGARKLFARLSPPAEAR
jgi:uncharacterized membrane protein